MKKSTYFLLLVALTGTMFSCGPEDQDPPVEPPLSTVKPLWLTSFEGDGSTIPDSTNALFAGSYSYSFDVTTGAVVTAGDAGVPATAATGTKMYQMKTTAAGQYYGGGFGWEPGTGNSFDTLDINDQWVFKYNFNGNTATTLKLQLVDPVDGDVFIYTVIPTATTGWQTATVNISDFTFDTGDPANSGAGHDKIINVSDIAAFKFIYFNIASGQDLEVYIDDITIQDVAGGSEILDVN